MTGVIDINEGKNNSYLAHGVGLILLAGILVAIGANIHWAFYSVATLVFVLAIFLFGASNGVEFDTVKMRYRVYGKIGPRKTGIWKSISNPTVAILCIYVDNSSKDLSMAMGFVTPTQEKITTFDLQIIDDLGQKHSIHDFLKYSIARKALQAVGEGFNIQTKDLIAEKMISNMKNPRR